MSEIRKFTLLQRLSLSYPQKRSKVFAGDVPEMATFKIGINMAGAISAGAYTAGVLDFLTEALDEWYNAKARGEAVPMHEVSIEVFSGASAGGMCAAISAVMLHEDFEHIHDTSKSGTTNRLYESWVNEIDIRELLKTGDLKPGAPIVSLLDSTIVSRIASDTLTPRRSPHSPRPYVSQNLTLFLSLTNLRGLPYSLNGAAPGSIEETTLFYGDRMRFEIVRANSGTSLPQIAHALDLTKSGSSGGWDLLQTAAMATGAFPVFLAPRILQRNLGEYIPPMWESVVSSISGTPPPVAPNIPPEVGSSFATLNVDGGVTNNDPFNYAHDYLFALDPLCPGRENLQDPMRADRAVISIAPFPTTDKFDARFDPAKESGIFSVLSRLVAALISQTRFFGESLNQIMTGTTFARFVIAPSDDELVRKHQSGESAATAKQPPALQCAALGAFGGFFERTFRAHDYALGRRNCQKFLRDYFVLPANNAIIEPPLDALDSETHAAVIGKFSRRAPGVYAESGEALQRNGRPLPMAQAMADNNWIPIIPLCSNAVADPLPPVPREQISSANVRLIVGLILKRFRAVIHLLLGQIPSWPLRFFLQAGQPFIVWLVRRPLEKALVRELSDSCRR
jgi:hypothetical protein